MGKCGSDKVKREAAVERGALGGWLRALADGLDRGGLDLDSGRVDLAGLRKLKISVRDEGQGALRVKLGVKYFGPAGPGPSREDEGGLPNYSALKKHMRQTFKAMGQALDEGRVPPSLEFHSFTADARLMAGYPGKGEDRYGPFLTAVHALEAAFASGDVPAMRAAHAALAQIKRECHSRLK
jgi:XXXCH domain-containing protein